MDNSLKQIVFNDCDPSLGDAIHRVLNRWRRYSEKSSRYQLWRLVQREVDRAIGHLLGAYPEQYAGYVAGANVGQGFGQLARTTGFAAVAALQRELIRRFIRFEECIDVDRTATFIATLETLYVFADECAAKRTRRAVRGGAEAPLNIQRSHGPCRFCGGPSELSAHLASGYWPKDDDCDFSKQLRLSGRFCTAHRPRRADGTWNPAYQRARRSSSQFTEELGRLTVSFASAHGSRSSFEPSETQHYADQILNSSAAGQIVRPGGLRELARKITDARLTDRKKQIMLRLAMGASQAEIARELGISRQAVSKALSTIPDELRLGVQKERPAR